MASKRTATRSARFIKSNYSPLFDGVDASKEQAERNALLESKKHNTGISQIVPRIETGMTSTGAANTSNLTTVKNNLGQVKSVTSGRENASVSGPVDPLSTEFESHVTDPTPVSPVLYISERYDVIGWDGPPTSPLCRRVVTRTHDGFTRNFYRLDERMFRRVCNECDRVLASGEAFMDEVDELFAKLDVVIEYARGKGWMASPSPSLS